MSHNKPGCSAELTTDSCDVGVVTADGSEARGEAYAEAAAAPYCG